MANPNQVVGQAKVKIDGQLYSTSKESTLEIGGTTRTPVEGDNEAGAFSAATVPSKLTTTLLYKGKVSLAALRDADNVTATVELDTGVTWIIRNGYTAEVISFGQDGKAQLVIQGPPAEELL